MVADLWGSKTTPIILAKIAPILRRLRHRYIKATIEVLPKQKLQESINLILYVNDFLLIDPHISLGEGLDACFSTINIIAPFFKPSA